MALKMYYKRLHDGISSNKYITMKDIKIAMIKFKEKYKISIWRFPEHVIEEKFVYKITNMVNNKVYFGKTDKLLKRIYNYTAKYKSQINDDLYLDIMSYGLENFKIEFTKEKDNIIIEKKLISEYNGELYNVVLYKNKK